MFADNQKISGRQLKGLLLMDWLGRLVLLLPLYQKGKTAQTVIAGTLAGCLLSGIFLWMVCRLMKNIQGDFCTYLKERLGSGITAVLYLIYGIYFLLQLAAVLVLAVSLAGENLLPELPMWLLVLLPLLTSWYLGSKGLEVRARVSELLTPVVVGFFLLMLVCTIPEIRWQHLASSNGMTVESGKAGNAQEPGAAGGAGSGQEPGVADGAGSGQEPGADLAQVALQVLACFGGIGILPLALGGSWYRKSSGRQAARALREISLFLLLAVLASYGVFGTAGMARLDWPVVSLMSVVKLPGGFLQRWDVLFLAVLMVTLFLAAGGGIYYVGKVGEAWGLPRWSGRVLAVVLSFAFFLVPWERERLLIWYRNLNFYLCVPILIFTILFLFLLETVRKRKKAVRNALLLLVVAGTVLVLTGCQVRELEERRFPAVLEIRAEDETLTVTCIWPEETTQDEGGINTGSTISVTGKTMEEAAAGIQLLQDRCVDYSHVKAILWRASLEADVVREEEVLEWLEKNPDFARNILICHVDAEELSLERLQKEAQGQPGTWLENLYQNNVFYKEKTETLAQLLYGDYRK